MLVADTYQTYKLCWGGIGEGGQEGGGEEEHETLGPAAQGMQMLVALHIPDVQAAGCKVCNTYQTYEQPDLDQGMQGGSVYTWNVNSTSCSLDDQIWVIRSRWLKSRSARDDQFPLGNVRCCTFETCHSTLKKMMHPGQSQLERLNQCTTGWGDLNVKHFEVVFQIRN